MTVPNALPAEDPISTARSEEHTSELQSQSNLVCRLLLEKKKHVLVNVIATERRQGNIELLFSVSDSGIGITCEKHAKIFEAFSQAYGSTTRKYSSTGIVL